MERTPGSALAAFAVLAWSVLAFVSGAASPLRATGTEVGVLPANGCPGDTAPLNIFIDNEDTKNTNGRSGWISTIASTGNTQFFLCRVDGDRFFHVPNNPYLVFSLGATCPHGSQTVVRTFDSEDHNPISSTNIDWVAEGLSHEVVLPGNVSPTTKRRDVQMTFCLFDGTGIHTGAMPQLGWDYGVFAPSWVSFAVASGYVHTDDQDPASWNRWCHDNSAYLNRTSFSCSPNGTTIRSYAGGALEGGTNTDLRIVKVKGTVCGDGVCRGTEYCGTCPQDCGLCQVCGNGICEVNEHCAQDCGYCGDFMCQGNETCSTCCGDCGNCNPWESCAQQLQRQ